MTMLNSVGEGVVPLNDCPPGLFLFGDMLGFKSEYITTLENPRRYQCDAYCVETGEYFHGGAKNSEARGRLLVTPVNYDARHRLSAPPATSDRGEGFLYTFDQAWDELVNKDDRTSPEEYPEFCLISHDELRSYMEARDVPPVSVPQEGVREAAKAAAEAWRLPTDADGTGELVRPKDDCVYGYEQGYLAALTATPTPTSAPSVGAEDGPDPQEYLTFADAMLAKLFHPSGANRDDVKPYQIARLLAMSVKILANALTAAPSVPASSEGDAGEGWLPITDDAKSGKLVELVVDYRDGDHPLQDGILACTVGFNTLDDTGEDEWKFAGWCWTHDHFVQGKGTPVAWRPSRLEATDDGLPLPALSPASPSTNGGE
jgi:hypothetical protein